ncbi:hypothetical protein BJ122_102243 [Rhodopseudomonas faecalis]|uniref:Uncharacterized protein n=1 Tax=Rhodopseudomonas faecalis TaxID=99655 RepID=A0A318TMC4_9BRAD|nr:hypothetical protein [Rhodopseudomonas faecalis]PYF05017.1 hypothetical protein BJ122_102243 [Rhodopseudomonas faecalis]
MLEFRPTKYANTDEFGGAKLYRGDDWLGTVWRHVCGWSWVLVCHPAKPGGGGDDFADAAAKLIAALREFEAWVVSSE